MNAYSYSTRRQGQDFSASVPEVKHLNVASDRRASALGHDSEVAYLRSKIAQLQGRSLGSRLVPTYPGLSRLLPGGGLNRGASYCALGSLSLALSLLAGPARAGGWCAMVGVPELNAEAAASFGIPLERLVLIPDAGRHWFAVVSALSDIMSAIYIGSTHDIPSRELDRFQARVRERGTVLITSSPLPRSEAQLSIQQTHWQGLHAGHGQLCARGARIASTWRNGTERLGELLFPHAVAPADTASRDVAENFDEPTSPALIDASPSLCDAS